MNDREQRKRGAAPSQQMMFSLISAARSIEKRYDDALAQVGLSGPKYAVLTHLLQAGEPLSLSACAEKMTCVRSNITQLMDRLEGDGLVERVEDPTDRRAVRATVTPLGVKRQAAGTLEVERVQKEFAKTLAGIDQDTLQRALDALR
jgi:DNA-binding MarR family transcriptional regulator